MHMDIWNKPLFFRLAAMGICL